MRTVEVLESHAPRSRTGFHHRPPPETINMVLVEEFRRS
jgi:hypothetical protein